MWRKLRRRQDGTTAVEFAMIAPAFLLLLFGLVMVALMYFDGSTLEFAVEQAGRSIATNPSVSQSDLTTAVQSQLGPIGHPPVTVTYTTSVVSGANVGHLVATLHRSYTVPMIKTFAIDFTSETYVPKM